MVNAFSEYARAPDMEMSSVHINQLIAEIADLYRVRDMAVEMELDLDPQLTEVEADPGRVRQILHNLVRNAIEAMEGEGDGHLLIQTRLENEGDARMFRLIVEDNGPGFPVDAMDHIFDPYVTSKPKGTGLGLAIVKKLVEEHGGRAEATNLDGGGARMSIVMPVDDEARTALLRRETHTAEYRGERA